MENSKFQMFKSLYLKDFREVRLEILIVVLAAVVFIGWAYLKTEGPVRTVIFVPAVLTMGMAVVLPVISSFKLLGREWRYNTIYMMMCLPISGTMMLGSKLLVIITQYVIGTLAVALTAGIALGISFPDLWQQFIGHADYYNIILAAYLASITGILFICCSSFLSQIVGKLSAKGSGFITFIVFIVVMILGDIIMPDTEMMMHGSQMMYSVSMHEISSLLLRAVFNLAFSAVVFVGSVLLWERRVEL